VKGTMAAMAPFASLRVTNRLLADTWAMSDSGA
jgi:hypothetical protein